MSVFTVQLSKARGEGNSDCEIKWKERNAVLGRNCLLLGCVYSFIELMCIENYHMPSPVVDLEVHR